MKRLKIIIIFVILCAVGCSEKQEKEPPTLASGRLTWEINWKLYEDGTLMLLVTA